MLRIKCISIIVFSLLSVLCIVAIIASTLLAVKTEDGSRTIVAGRNAVNGQFPHHVRIQDGFNHCDGSIIGKRYVLTSAIFVRNYVNSPNYLLIIVGEVDRHDGGIAHPVQKVTIHPQSDFYKNDIAVLRVAQAFQFTAVVQAIQLPTEDTPINNDGSALPATIVGWGQNRPGDQSDEANYPQILQWMNTTAISHSECRRLMPENMPDVAEYLRDNHICTRDADGAGACTSNSGGGLITNGADAHSPPVLIGVFSKLLETCPSPAPNFYTRVFPYLAFIRSAMRK